MVFQQETLIHQLEIVGNDNKGVLHSIPLSQHRITFPTELTASY